MIRIIAGGKKNTDWVLEAVAEYEKRLRKPFDVSWNFLEEEKLERYLADWPFSGKDFVIVCDERGVNLSSPEFSEKLVSAFSGGRDVVILIGGAYGFSATIRERADLVWSFSRLVFPHRLCRVMVMEQIYRASQIAGGGPYHHE